MGYMDVLYGIDNPALMDFAKNKRYLFGQLLPWLFRFLFTMRRINRLYGPVEDYLKRFTKNQALVDIIAQHFFKNTPTSFALSYFSLYLDYHYPKGGTATVVNRLTDYIINREGVINTGVSVIRLNPEQKSVTDSTGQLTEYRNLIWACDLKQMYNLISVDQLKNQGLIRKIDQKQSSLQTLTGGDSVFTVYLTINENKAYFSEICTGHFFYTPCKKGLSSVSKRYIDEFLASDDIQPENHEG